MDARRFDWADLELFLAVARGGSLAAAASVLRVDASTVHRRVTRMEAALRTRLFSRSPRGYALTSAGNELLPYATSIDEQAMAARRKLASRDEGLVGMVRVSAGDIFVGTVLSPIVASFRKKHPGVTVAFDVGGAFADLARQQADVAFRLATREPQGDLIAKRISKIGGAFYGSRAYFARHGRPERIEELRDHTTVRGDVTMQSFPGERTLDIHGDPERIAVRSNSFLARFAAVRDGMGIGMLAYFVGDREKDLQRLPFPVSDPEANLWLLIHVDLRQNARVRALTEHAYAALVAQRALFEGRSHGPRERHRGRSPA
jgi:DNA-binding transcriptional LysR family regulator